MEGIFLIVTVFLSLYTYFVGCYAAASAEFRVYEWKRAGKYLIAAWLILGLIWLVIGGQ